MRLLLDTHCWLWLKEDPARLPSRLRRRIIRDPGNLVLSSVVVLEVAIKLSLGKLRLARGPAAFVSDLLEDGVRPLAATVDHMLTLAALPPIHRDPFDRMLVAQAVTEGLMLVSADPQVLAYRVKSLDARQ
jgi:PIN domain nuclease of toxin-antitoxin system